MSSVDLEDLENGLDDFDTASNEVDVEQFHNTGGEGRKEQKEKRKKKNTHAPLNISLSNAPERSSRSVF
jgi:hypothetical protein